MKKEVFEITTLGCKVNQSESASIRAGLSASGCLEFKPDATDRATATVCIINTCTVTEKASMQSRQAIRRAIRNHPHAKIIVTGCYAQTQPEEIHKIKGVHEVVGHAEKHTLPEKILPPPTGGLDPLCTNDLPEFTHRTRAFLKIQDGCNAGCTYCIVPLARGASKSMPHEQVLKKIQSLEMAGHKEIVLSGIHLGCYGKDLSPAVGLGRLLADIEKSPIRARIRLSSIEPRELTDEIIALVAGSEKFCRHFHIPLQSGDDGILKKMERPYTRSFFRDLVFKIHALIPDAAIGIDTLIGFPGESEAAFHQTHDLVASLPVTYLHAFPFSSRQKTPAAAMPGRISPDILKSRCLKMRLLGEHKKKRFYAGYIGQVVSVLVEGKPNAESGRFMGSTSTYVPVFLDDADGLQNQIVQVLVTGMYPGGGVMGRVVGSSA